ncbi:hypothetical protein IVA98_27430 [Bradyrhizobium sp. 160]|uniref:hypothetical protein n=1 Tax=Bradyrhizobium sp. 160 TaxID=2782634 RepID=UPI001FFAE491|nr:hypothetical protein [Bradyrhizobium sp. 160]MCK1626818.1 hypothetical protein [Bradyrhizobium sp. 160]
MSNTLRLCLDMEQPAADFEPGKIVWIMAASRPIVELEEVPSSPTEPAPLEHESREAKRAEIPSGEAEATTSESETPPDPASDDRQETEPAKVYARGPSGAQQRMRSRGL